ncbi:MAG: GAF domain-containing protein [Gemmatimonadota bacterium]
MATPRPHRPGAGDEESRRPKAFLTLAENLPDIVVRFDRRLRHRYVNPAMERVTGIPRDAFLGRTNREIGFPEGEVGVWERHLRRTFETGRPDRFHFSYTGRDGPRRFESRLVPERGRGGRVETIVAVTRDLTERVRLERWQRFLVDATAVLGSSLRYDETLRRVAALAVPKIADWCVVYVAADGRLEAVALEHADPTKVAYARRLERRYPPRPEETVGIYQVFRSGEPELRPDVSDEVLRELAQDEEHLRILRAAGFRSALTVPLTARGRTLGVLSLLTTESERRFHSPDVPFVTTLADRAAVAIDNAGLFEEVRAGEQRADFLARVSGVVATSLDYDTTLRALARLVVPRLADWCIVDVVEAGAQLEIRRVATEHAEEARAAVLRELRRRYSPDRDSPQPAARAIRTGQPVYYEHFSDDDLARTTTDAEHARLLRSLGVHSLIAVPLIARGQTLGALTVVSASAERTYRPEDRALVHELGRRAAVAIDNARLYERALVASRAKSDFLTVMSHELRTPLNAAMGYADLLAAGTDGPVTVGQARQIERLKASMQQLLGLVDRVIEFSRAGAGDESVRTETFDLAAMIEEVVAIVRPRAVEKGLAVEVDLPAAPWRITSDPDKIRTILMSLVSNAEKFTDEGEIGVRGRREGGEAVIEVFDTGVGIEPAARERIFEPFTQISRPTTRRVGGVGLGLAVARRMARRVGGEVEVEGAPGRGSTFRVRLPVHWPDDQEAGGEG